MPNKPTQPFGHIVFRKVGKVEKKIFQLSNNKEHQEIGALEIFIEVLNKVCSPKQITEYSKLPENDQDFKIKFGSTEVIVQLTELVDRTFTFPMTQEEYDNSNWKHCILKESGQIPWRIDMNKMNLALKELIQKKIEKNYSKDKNLPLWLIVFTTCSNYHLKFWENGQLQISENLIQATNYLEELNNVIFDEIWFTDLQTSPVQVWSGKN